MTVVNNTSARLYVLHSGVDASGEKNIFKVFLHPGVNEVAENVWEWLIDPDNVSNLLAELLQRREVYAENELKAAAHDNNNSKAAKPTAPKVNQ